MENHVLAAGTLHLVGEPGRSSAQNWQMMCLGVTGPIWGQERGKRPFCSTFYHLTFVFLELVFAGCPQGWPLDSTPKNKHMSRDTNTGALFKDKCCI